LSTTSLSPSRAVDDALRERARRVIPGGMYGHLATSRLGPAYPQFMARGEGARAWDVDGREFIDLMCAFGPILLGHAHPEVDAVAAARSAQGDVLNTPGPEMVELAEFLVSEVDHADWAMFAKNGSDADNLALVVARAHTGRAKVLMAHGSYHGIGGWALPPEAAGTTPADHADTVFFEYNDLDSIEAALAAVGEDQVAAIVCTPHRHDVFMDQIAVAPEFARGVREICDRIGAALILDEVRCGARIDLRGSWAVHGVAPDLSAWSKSLANGYPLAALMGSEAFREAATKIFATGSFWYAAAPMAAALKTLEILKAGDGIAAMRTSGLALQEGLRSLAADHGYAVSVSGPPQMPLLQFQDDPEYATVLRWAGLCATHGVYLHPVHNWFVSVAATPAIIDEALERIDLAFADLKATPDAG
jgi:glutamate-1-semialdehyde 2,1-aminomutase